MCISLSSPWVGGEGFNFSDTIVGGVVPKQYIPSVENGVREYLAHGPPGLPGGGCGGNVDQRLLPQCG